MSLKLGTKVKVKKTGKIGRVVSSITGECVTNTFLIKFDDGSYEDRTRKELLKFIRKSKKS